MSLAERARTLACGKPGEGWRSFGGLKRGGENFFFLQGFGMTWLSRWFYVLCMAVTSALGDFQKQTRWAISLCGGCCKSYLWNGYHNASDCRCCSGQDVRTVGRELLPLKSCMRGGACSDLYHKGVCCVNYPGSILIFAGQCCVLAVFAATLHWMSWTSSKLLMHTWLKIRRSLRGACRMQQEAWHQAGSFLEQVVWIIFVPLIVLMSMAGGLVYVPGTFVISYRCSSFHSLQGPNQHKQPPCRPKTRSGDALLALLLPVILKAVNLMPRDDLMARQYKPSRWLRNSLIALVTLPYVSKAGVHRETRKAECRPRKGYDISSHMPGTSPQDQSPAVPPRSRLGPKSQGHCYTSLTCWIGITTCFYMIQPVTTAAVSDARVGFFEHRENPEARYIASLVHTEAKHGVHSNMAVHSITPQTSIRKRALKRAIHRASNREDQSTWYRGKRMTLKELTQRNPANHLNIGVQSEPLHRQSKRLNIITWNEGGLTSTRYQEILQWLEQEHSQGHVVDLMIIQETAWQQDLEFTSQPVSNGQLRWHIIHSAGAARTGVMCLIRQGLVQPDQIRSVAVLPGRLLHIRLLMEVPLDVLGVYQVAWNPHKATLPTSCKTETLLKQRNRIWQHLHRWLRTIPARNGCILAGDFNEHPWCRGGVTPHQGQHQDRTEFQDLIRVHQCTILNTWRSGGASARTFLSPGVKDSATNLKHGSQIDYILVRGTLVDNQAKQAGPLPAPFVPDSGCRHLPVKASVPMPHRPKTIAPTTSKLSLTTVRKCLRDTDAAEIFAREVAPQLAQAAPQTNLDAILLTGWNQTMDTSRRRGGDPALPARQEGARVSDCVRQLINTMWQVRANLRRLHQPDRPEGEVPPSLWMAWHYTARLQAVNRELRKQCRHRKVQKIQEVVASANVFQAAKQFGPKQPRRRLQLRSPEGAIQTREVEHRQILDYFQTLYAGPDYKPVTLSSAAQIEEAEVAMAMTRIQAAKAMPPDSAPSPLWKLASSEAVPILTQQFNFYLTAGATSIPEPWCRSELALLPKPGKSLCHPDQLRPINLLPLQAKLLGSIIAMRRLVEHATRYLADTHQYAYLPDRSLGQALERVTSHCAQARQLVDNQHLNPHARRQGKQSLAVAGGCQLSLDISKAYDRVCWRDLETALTEAGVPQGLIELILLLHQTAVMNVTHCGITGSFSLGRGLRQGCGLAPLLWTIYIGWILKGLHKDIDPAQSLVDTAYADDLHYSWLVTSGKALEKAYSQMKAILGGLCERGLKLSMEKTVILMSLGGPQAKACLHRYTVPHPDTKRLCIRLNIGGKQIHIQVVTQQLYLGIQIGYGRFEQQTFAYRQQLAKHTNTRLAPVLKCRSLPCQLRLRLWQSTVIPTMLHGLDCVGLPNTTAETMWAQFFKQSRSIITCSQENPTRPLLSDFGYQIPSRGYLSASSEENRLISMDPNRCMQALRRCSGEN